MNHAGIIEIIITVPIGILFIILGFNLWKKQKIQWIHDYHHEHVQFKDKKAYTKLWGIGLMIFGIFCCFVGVIDFLFDTEMGWLFFIIGMVICFLIGNKAQRKYNGSWLS